MDPKTAAAHNAGLTGYAEMGEIRSQSEKVSTFHMMSKYAARVFVDNFKRENPDIQLSNAQWTKLIDALHG